MPKPQAQLSTTMDRKRFCVSAHGLQSAEYDALDESGAIAQFVKEHPIDAARYTFHVVPTPPGSSQPPKREERSQDRSKR